MLTGKIMDSTVAAPETPFLGSSKETVAEETIKILLKSASESSRLILADFALRTDDILILLSDEIQNARSALHLQEVNFNNCVIYTKDKGFELFIDTLCEQRSLEIFIARKSDLQPDIGSHMEKLITTSGCLRVLDLNGNSLQATGVTALSKAFYRSINELPTDSSLFSLQFLHLSYNNIGDSGVLALCRGLVQFARRSFTTSRPSRMRCLALSGNHLTDKAAYCLAQLLNTKYIGSTSHYNGKMHSPKGLFNHFQFPLEELQLEDNPEMTGRGLTALLGDIKTSMYSPLKRMKAAHCTIDCAAIEGLSTVLLQQSSPLLELLDISMTESIVERCITQSASQFSRVYGTPIAQSLHGSLKRLSDTLLTFSDTKPKFTLILGSLHRIIFNHACHPKSRNEEEDCLRALENLNPVCRFLGGQTQIPRILGSVRDWVSGGVYEVRSQGSNSNIVAVEVEVETENNSSESFFASPPPALPSPPTMVKEGTSSGSNKEGVNSAAKRLFLQRMASRRSNTNTSPTAEEEYHSDTSGGGGGGHHHRLSSLQELKVVDQVTPRQSSNTLKVKEKKKEKEEKQSYDRYGNKIGLSTNSHSSRGGVSFGTPPPISSSRAKLCAKSSGGANNNNKHRSQQSQVSYQSSSTTTNRTRRRNESQVVEGEESDNPLLNLSTELRLALNPSTTTTPHYAEREPEEPLSAQVRGVLGDLSSRLAMIATQQRRRDDLRARHVTEALLVHQMAVEKEQEVKTIKRQQLLKRGSKMSMSIKTEKDEDDDEEGESEEEDDVEELLDSDSLSASPPPPDKKSGAKSENHARKTKSTAEKTKHSSSKNSKKKNNQQTEDEKVEENAQPLTAESVAAMIEARLTTGKPLPPTAAAHAATSGNNATSTALTTTTTAVHANETEAEQLKRCQEELEVLRTVSSSRDTSLTQKLQSLEHRLLRMELALTGTTGTSVSAGAGIGNSSMHAADDTRAQAMMPASHGYSHSQSAGHNHSNSHNSTNGHSNGHVSKGSRPMAIETRLIQQLGGLHLLDHYHSSADQPEGGGGSGGAWVNELGHRLEAIEQMLRADKQFHQQQEEEDLHRKIEDRRALRHRWIEALASQQPPQDAAYGYSKQKEMQMQQQQESDRDEVESVASIYSLPRYQNKSSSNNLSVPGTPVATTQVHSINKDHSMMINGGLYPRPLTPSHLPPLPFMSAALHSHSASSDGGDRLGGGGGNGKERFIRPVIPEYEFATLRPAASGLWDAYGSSHAHGQRQNGQQPGSNSKRVSSRGGKSYMQSTNSSRKLKQYGATTPL